MDFGSFDPLLTDALGLHPRTSFTEKEHLENTGPQTASKRETTPLYDDIQPLFASPSTDLGMAGSSDKGDYSDSPSIEDSVGTVMLFGVPIVCLYIDNKERLCLAQISNTILRDFSYNEIHNRRVALGITCMQCSPSQLEILRRTGAMPISSRRCGLITKREAERLVKSFMEDIPPPRLPEDFAFKVSHGCGWGSKGLFMPSRYNSSRAKCIKCISCDEFFSPNKFIFHYHKLASGEYKHPDAANFNSWRRHLYLADDNPSESLLHAWEDVKAMFNGGCRKRFSGGGGSSSRSPTSLGSPNGFSDMASCSRFPRMTGSLYNYSNYSSFVPPMNRPHSAFVNPLYNRITSYGDFLRSLSLPYNSPWSGKLEFPQPSLGVQGRAEKHGQFPMGGHNLLHLNVPYPGRGPWAEMPCLPTRSNIGSLPMKTSQPCFPEKLDLSKTGSVGNCSQISHSSDQTKMEPSAAKKQRVTPPEPDSSNDIEQKRDLEGDSSNSGLETDLIDVEETRDFKDEPKPSDCPCKEKQYSADDEVYTGTIDETLDTDKLRHTPIDSLKAAVARAVSERRHAEQDREKIEGLLRLQAIKELELREEFARQFSSIKENIWSEIEQEKATKGNIEEKLRETRQLLQSFSCHVPETVPMPTCK